MFRALELLSCVLCCLVVVAQSQEASVEAIDGNLALSGQDVQFTTGAGTSMLSSMVTNLDSVSSQVRMLMLERMPNCVILALHFQ